MRAFDPEVSDAVWETFESLIPVPVDNHPLGCHRPRASDKDCFRVILVRLVTGCSWEDAEAVCGRVVSDTTVRARRDEWIAAGVFDTAVNEAISGYDRIIGLDLTETAVDGSLHKAPCGGPGTGKNPTDRGKLGWKWSILTDRWGIPIGWAIDGANRNDVRLFEPTLAHVAESGLHLDIETIHLDKGYDNNRIRTEIADYGITDAVIDRRRRPGEPKQVPVPTKTGSHTMGKRWPVERTNSWLTNFGQLRRNTDRKPRHRHAQMCMAVTFLLAAKLVDWKTRWSDHTPPIR